MAVPNHRFACLFVVGLLCVNATSQAQAPAEGLNGVAELDSGAALERARIYYESARYGACADAFTRLLDRPDTLNARERPAARTYLAACLIARGKIEEARQQFRQAILEDRQLEPPDPVVFPQAVIDVFLQVRSSLMDALRRQQEEDLRRSEEQAAAQLERAERERQRIAELERLAALETVIRKNERWMAWIPFGLGQFHNDDQALGWFFLTSEAVLAVTAVTATSIELGLHSRAQGGRAALDAGDLTDKVRAARQVGTAAWLGLVGVAVAGILEANISYRDELPAGQRRRALPESLRRPEAARIRPAHLEPLIGAGWVGLRGEF